MNVSKCLHDLTVFTKSEKLDHCLFLHLNFWACSYRLMAQVIGSFNMASGIIFYELGIDFVSIWFLGLWLGPWNQCYQSSPKPSVLHEYKESVRQTLWLLELGEEWGKIWSLGRTYTYCYIQNG